MGAMMAPPMAPDVQAQMPGGPKFGPGIAGAQEQAGKSPVELAYSTAEKLLNGVSDDAFKPYVKQALAILQIGVAKSAAGQAKSPGATPPPGAGQGAPSAPAPPTPGAMPG